MRRRWSATLGWQFRAYVVIEGTHHAGPWRGNKNPNAPGATRTELIRYIDEASGDARRLRERAREAKSLHLITVEEAMHLWLERCETKGRTSATIRYYVEIFERVGEFLDADSPLHTIGVAELEKIRRSLLASKKGPRVMSPVRADKILNALGSVFRYAIKRGHLAGPNPVDMLDRFEARPRVAEHFGVKQLEAIVKALRQAKSKANPTALEIVLTLFFAGCNVMGLARMRVRDFDKSARTLYIDEKRRQRRIPVSEPLQQLLERLGDGLGPDDFLLPTPVDNGKRKRTTLPDEERRCDRIRKTLQRARRHLPEPLQAAFHAHTFRHSSVEFLRSRGVDRAIRMAYFGHKNPDMHARYEHPSLEEIRAEVCGEVTALTRLVSWTTGETEHSAADLTSGAIC